MLGIPTVSLDNNDIKWLLKVIKMSQNLCGSDLEQAAKTINKLQKLLKENKK